MRYIVPCLPKIKKKRKKKLFNYKYYEIPGNVYAINDPFAI